MLILGRVTGADQARQEQLAATLGRRPGTGPRAAPQRLTAAGSGLEGGQYRRNRRAVGASVASEPAWRPRRSPVRQDQARKSPPAGVRARTPEDCRADGRATLDSHPGGRAGCVPHPASAALGTCGLAACGTHPGLLCLPALSIAPLSLCVRQSQCGCTPLRNGVPVGTLGIQLAYRISLQVDAVGAVTMRSQIASAMVGSPITSCQDDTGRDTIRVEARAWRSSRIPAVSRAASSGSNAKSSMISSACLLILSSSRT